MLDMPTDHLLAAGELILTLDKEELTVWDGARRHRLLLVPLAGVMRPVLDGVAVPVQVQAVERQPGALVVRYAGPGLAALAVTWRAAGDHLELSASCTPAAGCELNRLDLLPPGTGLNLYDVVNYRNRHHSAQAWPELNLGGKGCATDTYSTDWQFAPHPTMMVLRKGADHLLVGALDLTTAYGMYLAVANHRVQHWHLDYGEPGHGQRLAAGTAFHTPRFALILDRRGEVGTTIRRWTDLLVEQGAIPDPRTKVRHAWHTAPLYCTWIDQCSRGAVTPPAELQDQEAALAPAIRVLDQGMVREALALIRRERLPFGTILLDDGWQVARGDWRAHPQRFPDLRALVDEIHAAGMKVMVWWAWPEIAKHAVVDPAFLIGGGRLNRHGARMFDFSHPQVQERYLRPLFHQLFSSDPGCYDLDGVKTDFMADKVHADMPPFDPAWRGEENFFARFYALFHAEMRRHKPDACHLGCAGHPWLAAVTEANRTFDVGSSNVAEHEARGLMLEATSPGCPVSLDFHNFCEHFAEVLALARRRGWAIEVGNLMMMKRDHFAPWQPADAGYLEVVRRAITPDQARLGAIGV